MLLGIWLTSASAAAQNVPDDCESEDNFGAALATGDFDGDGTIDLAIGVPNDNETGVTGSGP